MQKYVIKTILSIWYAAAMLAGSSAAAQMFHADKPDTAKRCAVCHYQWVYPFYAEQRDGELAPRPQAKAVASPEMCLSCHDGSVADSRKRVFHSPGHHTGIVPSDKVSIPEEFPLDESGQIQCATCHSPHALPSETDTGFGLFLRAENKNSQFCKTCHTNNEGGPAQGNHAIDISATAKTSDIIKNGGRFGTDREKQIICETCHSAHGGLSEKLLILPVAENSRRSALCEACHSQNPGTANGQPDPGGSHPVGTLPQKTKIPSQWSSGAKIVLNPSGALLCRTCHTPHGAAGQKALLVDHNHQDSLCMQCHKSQKTIVGSSHDMKITAPDEKNIRGHRAAETGPCSSCHLAHKSNTLLLWARQLHPTSQSTVLEELCISCHAPGQCGGKALPGEASHPVNVLFEPDTPLPSLPLFDTDNRPAPQGTLSCLTCHRAHDPAPLYMHDPTAPVKRGAFLRLARAGVTNLCISCHKQQASIIGTDHDLTLSAPDFINVFGQKVEQKNICSSCHVAHNASLEKYLWAGPLGKVSAKEEEGEPKAEANSMERTCTGCHSGGNAAAAQIPRYGQHPPGVQIQEDLLKVALDSSDTPLPVFNDQNEAPSHTGPIIVCSTCHNPHQWDPKKNMPGPGIPIEGDATNSFLRPGLPVMFCAGCHGQEALFKFKYFHSHIGRKQNNNSFSFKKH